MWYHLYVESKVWHTRPYLWNRNKLTDTENRLVVTKGDEGGGGMHWVRINRGKLSCISWIDNKVLLYSTGESIQYPMIKKNYEKECMRTFQWLRLCASNAGGTDSIPGQGTRIPHTMCHGLKRKKRERKNACICVTESTGVHSSQHCKLTTYQ